MPEITGNTNEKPVCKNCMYYNTDNWKCQNECGQHFDRTRWGQETCPEHEF